MVKKPVVLGLNFWFVTHIKDTKYELFFLQLFPTNKLISLSSNNQERPHLMDGNSYGLLYISQAISEDLQFFWQNKSPEAVPQYSPPAPPLPYSITLSVVNLLVNFESCLLLVEPNESCPVYVLRIKESGDVINQTK